MPIEIKVTYHRPWNARVIVIGSSSEEAKQAAQNLSDQLKGMVPPDAHAWDPVKETHESGPAYCVMVTLDSGGETEAIIEKAVHG